MKTIRIHAMAALLATSFAAAVTAAEVNVSPGNLNGWHVLQASGSTLTFVSGAAAPPCGTGSAAFTVDPTGAKSVQLLNEDYGGVALGNLTSLSYSTYVPSLGNGKAVCILLTIDPMNGDPVDVLIFEPAYQGTAVVPGTWQTWNARNGLWWSLKERINGAPAGTVKPLAAFGNAVIVNTTSATLGTMGGVRLFAGAFGGSAPWADFVGNADCFRIAVAGGSDTTFDFELDADNDGVADNLDACVPSDKRSKVDVNGSQSGDTGINNIVEASGSSIQDQVNACIASVTPRPPCTCRRNPHSNSCAITSNHLRYAVCIAELAERLCTDRVITSAQGKKMIDQALKSKIGM